MDHGKTNKIIVNIVAILALVLVSVSIIYAESIDCKLVFGNQNVDPEIKAISRNGAKYINMPFLIKYMHMMTEWDPDTGNIHLKFGKNTVRLTENRTSYTIDGKTMQLKRAPFEQNDQLWIPVEFLLKMGLIITKEDAKSLQLDWAQNYLLAIENTKYEDRPALLLVGTKKFDLNSFLLVQPDRLVIDLAGFKAHPALDSSNHRHPLIDKIRINQFEKETLRIVFDLKKLAGYKIIPHPEHENQVLLVFNYFVEKISFEHRENERKVLIKSSFPAKYTVTTRDQPRRFIIDFDGATLVGNNDPIPGDNQWITGIRMSQFNPQTVRVVLDVIDSVPIFVVPSRQDSNLLEIRSLQQVTNVKWNDIEGGGTLEIEGDGALIETVQRFKNPYRLLVMLDYCQLAKGVKIPKVSSDQIKNCKITSANNQTVIEFELNYYLGYTVRFSNDRRKLMISFKESPLIDKTIVLDPGHGGIDMGATGRQGTREKEVNYEVTIYLKDLLEEAGAQVVLTRTDDYYIGLYERSYIANYLFADLFISIHTNFHPKDTVRGIEVYHHPGRSDGQVLARYVESKMVETTKLTSLGIKTNDFVVIRETQMPSILVELGYLSNFEEENILLTSEFRKDAAAGIFQGILDYYFGL
ncbi:MAG TPA: N-acetylmuramoyl-L-alanine amidase [Bacillota bacterium]|nr:N-acetylmuramoyl-L-alanine amidase [Bacillota bacterium]HOL09500.1 N-acetylmuramoyl-L-alanine amidase [Bacillota bacterium]HPO97538.1 N-acetylmuramoyl-L-alanine amidase [Bacillota bacterium]